MKDGSFRVRALVTIARLHLPLAVVLTLSSNWVYAQTPTCAPPGCNSVASDSGENTAMGSAALASLITGGDDTAAGSQALHFNLYGTNDSAFGAYALYSNTYGNNNTAAGFHALIENTTGNYNTAVGSLALQNNTTASDNTAVGYNALYTNQTGSDNTAVGFQALNRNVSGYHNTASGYNALFLNGNGMGNAALGYRALYSNTSGSSNIAVGNYAGYSVTGSNNIDIGAEGVAAENGVVRIGTTGTHSSVYISGISTTMIAGGSPVYVGANGQLGIGGTSSERYKTQITPIGSASDQLQRLWPVSFRFKNDPEGSVHYGLVAEEVAKVYPELVIRDASGVVQGVRYDELAPMLLNELQQMRSHEAELRRDMQQQLDVLRQMVANLRASNARVAMR